MKREDFADLLFKIEELLTEVDCWRRQINDCKVCPGWAVEDYKNMCPSCLQALHEELEALKRLSVNAEMRKNLMILKKALERDTTGELLEIFGLTRRTTDN